jgi:cholesterol transport system auxiliary component
MIRNRRITVTHKSEKPERGSADCTVRTSHFLAFSSSCLLAAALIAGGCTNGSSRNEQHFILEAVRQGSPVRPVTDGSLEVHRFSVDTAFVTKNLVYRLGEFKYEADYYRQFLISPGTMITEKTRDWLADSGLFNSVLPVGSRIVPSYTLEGNVIALYGDFTDEAAPTAVMEIRLFLLENSEGRERVIFSKTYRTATDVPSRATDDFVDALNRSLMEIMTRLEADLPKALAGKTEDADNSAGR